MTSTRIIPAKQATNSFKVANSTFISTAAPVFSVDEAKKFILKIRGQYQDAAHNVPVYIIGHPPSVVEHSSDDGEPAGTAGRPALAVLRGSGFGDIAVVVTRYFGGTKLGTGGLVRAYSDSMRDLLAIIPKAEKISTITTQIRIEYPLFGQVEQIVKNHSGDILQQDFKLDVSLEIKFKTAEFQKFQTELLTLTNGEITALPSNKNPDDIFPLMD
jgi:uncharacterized YigZ family protein